MNETDSGPAGFYFDGCHGETTFVNCRASNGDDTAYVQGLLDRGLPIPAGIYSCQDGVRVPAGYMELAREAGRQPDAEGGFPLCSDPELPAVFTFRDNNPGGVTLGRISPNPHAPAGEPQTDVWIGRDGTGITYSPEQIVIDGAAGA